MCRHDFPARLDKALQLLLDAFDYAHDTGQDVWELAVGIMELTKAGAFPIDLRWLICKNFAEHADEIIVNGVRRRFRRTANLAFTDHTHFVLTPDGEKQVRTPRSTPHWDKKRRELKLSEKVVKQFRVPAPIQERILDVFEEEGWPERIDDPLSPPAEGDEKSHLRAAIRSLNRNQHPLMVRFRGTGDGEHILWELVDRRHKRA